VINGSKDDAELLPGRSSGGAALGERLFVGFVASFGDPPPDARRAALRVNGDGEALVAKGRDNLAQFLRLLGRVQRFAAAIDSYLAGGIHIRSINCAAGGKAVMGDIGRESNRERAIGNTG
jgi:hypothetical protein